VLDRTPCRETIKVGLLFVGSGQRFEGDILANNQGSARYERFLRLLGDEWPLTGATFFTAGLDTRHDIDGRSALIHCDELTEMCFHVATRMPVRSEYKHFENKKRHVGNDSVTIVWLDAESSAFGPETLRGQCNLVNLVVQPLLRDRYRVSIVARHAPLAAALSWIADPNLPLVVGGASIAALIRRLCIVCHAFLCCMDEKPRADAGASQLQSPPGRYRYLPGFLERYEQIKRLGERGQQTTGPLKPG
jgi:hypothetical protein